ncbi:MAG: serine hydrolase [Bacteroidales bacterium]|jgi:CubicO group peptidase (beta-lactamase class C family)|nr:serine hydrolase [Bacteroidales bacterium]MDD4385215.1 serine hydrolase [Bacteroidales bacterium]MDY0198220.1 serine hydrolase domain-containing protein [Tenuifilaceae bacterium]
MKTIPKHILHSALVFFMLTGFSSFAQRAPHIFFNTDSIKLIDQDILNDKYGKISSLLVFKGSKLVHEKYFGFSQISTLHPISSVTKSITSIAVGICLDSGLIKSIDVPIHTYFPEYQSIFNADKAKEQITLRHLLGQTAGFNWDEWTIHYSYAGNPLVELSQNPDSWIPIVLSLPMDSTPGTKYTYNSACSDLIKEIVCRSTGMDFVDFIDEQIFKKLDIQHYHWDIYPGNGNPAWGGLSLTTRDMAKIGVLMLNKGQWRNRRVVSEEWVNLSTSKLVEANDIAYGLHWWVTPSDNPSHLFYAAGYGDQYIIVDTNKEVVIAINAKNFSDHKWDDDYKHLIKRILNAYAL